MSRIVTIERYVVDHRRSPDIVEGLDDVSADLCEIGAALYGPEPSRDTAGRLVRGSRSPGQDKDTAVPPPGPWGDGRNRTRRSSRRLARPGRAWSCLGSEHWGDGSSTLACGRSTTHSDGNGSASGTTGGTPTFTDAATRARIES
ncbi:hypothetical protein [Streptomyces sp. NPDC004266]|uniref:hypothetical protein n=1 Tax=Streptomyces sp. NPDC004266 TaxID=3364693 RepID=UPI0036831903